MLVLNTSCSALSYEYDNRKIGIPPFLKPIPSASSNLLSQLSKLPPHPRSLPNPITLKPTNQLAVSFLRSMDLSVVSYSHVTKSENDNDKEAVLEPMLSSPKTAVKTVVKYRECMRNHAASMGGHANDGCGEFMPRGGGDSRESLTCAACGCHRNFHMREVIGRHFSAPTPMLLYNACTAAARPHHRYDGGDRRSETPERVEPSGTVIRAGTGTTAAKRFRTRFTQEQKDKMLEFAERIGWRIQRQDDVALNQFCSELGIKRNVLKVWMHNNKNAHRRRDSAHQSPPSPPPPPPSQPVGV